MNTGSNFDVVVVGAGAAGLTAAIGLARAGFAVVAVEAAPFPGAENWSGCVYFCENLAHPDILGPQGVEALAWERRLVERGFFTCDGYGLLGIKYRDPQAFRHCYTVLRPIYDHHLAQIAVQHGVALLCGTTVESLVRDHGRIIGVCTNRGPLYADLVFLAEGDASHLVTREGYERFTDQREKPKFLQGIKQVIDLPEGAVERLFGVGPLEGAAYEMLLRNGTLRGRNLQLNMGGFVYTNRQSLSVGLVLPLEHLHESFQGDPNLLMEWFLGLPALRPWMRDGKRGVFGAKLIRSGGARDIPTLIDEGLAIGGAASGIGIDFPFPNFTGPATAMGLLIAQAASRIRAEGADFTRDNLRRHYLEPLQQSHYWQDVDFLRNWPGYVKRTRAFFGRDIDVVMGSAFIWTRPRRWSPAKWINWLRLILQVAGPGQWREMRNDLRHFLRALRLREVISRPALGKLLLDGTINALRDLAGKPRPNLPAAGEFRVHYSVAGSEEQIGNSPRIVRRWFARMAPVLAATARKAYTNDDTPLSAKLPNASQLLLRQINMLDLLVLICTGVLAGITASFITGWRRASRLIRSARKIDVLRGIYPEYARAVQTALEIGAVAAVAGPAWEERLGTLAYDSVKASHIHLRWPTALQEKNAVVEDGLWHVCPAHVYEARQNANGQLQVVVNFENCIKCESCWRAGGLADWGRDGQHRFIYPVSSPAVERLLEAMQTAGPLRVSLPRALDHWQESANRLDASLQGVREKLRPIAESGDLAEVHCLLEKLETKLIEFDAALAEEPRHIDHARAEFLEMLVRYAQQLALRIVEVLRESVLAYSSKPGLVAAHQQVLDVASALLARSEERSRRIWDKQFAWAAADGRQLRHHHCAGLRRMVDVLQSGTQGDPQDSAPPQPWLRAEDDEATLRGTVTEWKRLLDAAFAPLAWRELERGAPLSAAQDALLRDLIAQTPLVNPADTASPLHAPLRKALLAELGRRDPSLAFRVAAHLWARDLTRLRTVSPAFSRAAERWSRGEEWACFVDLRAAQSVDGKWRGEALFVPVANVGNLLMLLGDQLVLIAPGRPGLRIERLATLGLRGAGLCRVVLDDLQLPESRITADADRLLRAWQVLSAADLTSIALGMADQLCTRALGHATSRVQFPGLFYDEEARDTIGKFGAIKKMIAQIAARRFLIETLDHTLSPTDFSSASAERAGLIKAVAAEALGTAPGSISYNAGQIFGGTGYSEDDILSKFYRDAAAWRYIGAPDSQLFRRHGDQLLRNWQADGRRLATLDQEAQFFDEVAQRKALQAELDGVRVLRSGLRAMVNEWQKSHRDRLATRTGLDGASGAAAAHAEVAEQIARQDARLLAGKALLLRTHARLEHGIASEIELALLRLWFLEAGVALEDFQARVKERVGPIDRHADRPLVDPAANAPVSTYAAYLATESPYDSGDFLVKPVDPSRPRFVPELVEMDEALAARDRELREQFSAQFASPRADGLTYERYIERQHRPDAADLNFCRQHGFFRMPIPRELGGEGKQKVDYYLVTTNAQRLADVAVSLTIQANTSIGTTPILLARDKDLPRASKDLAAFIAEETLQRQMQDGLDRAVARLPSAGMERTARIIEQLHKQLEEKVFSRTVLRVLMHRFGDAWEEARAAARTRNQPALQSHLKEAAGLWKDACGRARELQEEVERRRTSCDLFLRWIASGQISAFALTEPSAGSDTARVATRARLRSVRVERDVDGVLSFTPAGGEEMRYLVDARRLEFRGDRVWYRWSESSEPAQLRFDEYDYETDDPSRALYYQHAGRVIHFCDITQLRERDGRLWYDYWELTGAKMWITNGRMAGLFCLYAKTDEGITGFMVDRHAEGLVVGKDEAKMGQLGSPTNELSLQAVRVPRENVLGLEGRGQVNALETLNVGRAGLAMSAVAQMEGLIEMSRAFARAKYGATPDWVEWRLERMEESRFTAEAVAYDVVGRFEHPGTKSVRMETAIAKMLASELLHEIIELAEDIHGLAGQTQLYLVEKRKRDARILNIYEGTNEIQRFSLLKDLATEIAPRWSAQVSMPLPPYLGPEAVTLQTLKAEFQQRAGVALQVFGGQIWQNPNLQANCFLVAEAAAWIMAAESTLGRSAWLEQQGNAGEDQEPCAALDVGRRASVRCQREIRQRLHQFDEELAHLRRGYYAVEVRAASLLCQRSAEVSAPEAPVSEITRPLSILVVVEPSSEVLPHPHVSANRIVEPYAAIRNADRSALEMALRLREQAAAPVTITVAAVGPRWFAQSLREVLSLGVDQVHLLLSDGEPIAPDSAASALAAVLAGAGSFELVLGGAADEGNEDGVVATLTAAALRVIECGTGAAFAVRKQATEAGILLADAGSRRQREVPLPAFVSVRAGAPLRIFTVFDYLNHLAKGVELQRWPRKLVPRRVRVEEAQQPANAAGPPQIAQPISAEAAAALTLERTVGASIRTLRPFTGTMENLPRPPDLQNAVVGLIAAQEGGRLQASAVSVLVAATAFATAEATHAVALALVDDNEETQREIVEQILAVFKGRIVLLVSNSTDVPLENGRLLTEVWPTLTARPRVVVAESWAEAGMTALGGKQENADPVVLRVRALHLDDDRVTLETARWRGKLRVYQSLVPEPGSTVWISLVAEAEVLTSAPSRVEGILVQRWKPLLKRGDRVDDMHHLLGKVKEAAGLVSLAEADFVIDVGFGVVNRDGYDEVIQPLERVLRDLGIRNIAVGGSRKVTEELHLLPAERQIGQSGVAVNPQIVLAIGISGAPQHVNYIGSRAAVLAFNRDPEAPLMTLNQRQPRPRVYPVIGDLFETVPAFIAALRKEKRAEQFAEPVLSVDSAVPRERGQDV